MNKSSVLQFTQLIQMHNDLMQKSHFEIPIQEALIVYVG